VQRALLLSVLLFGGCQAVERVSVSPLPDNAAPMPFGDLVARARLQATAANEAFYVDNWLALEDVARGIEQTSRFLKRSQDVPAARMADLDSRCDTLAREAGELRISAQKHDIQQINAILQRIHYQVRELRS
jgi:uncharacterized alpha-E superfamily protein